MRDSAALSAVIWIAGIAIVLLGVQCLRLSLRMNERVADGIAAWRERELDALRTQLQSAAQAEARGHLERWKVESEADIRSDAVKRSSAVVSGKVTEHLAPYMDAFPFNPKDARFLGTPVDLIVFDGMSDDALSEIVFLEIKTGGSSLSTRERRVRDAVLNRRVAWKEFRVGGD